MITSLAVVAIVMAASFGDERWPPRHDIPEDEAHAALAACGQSYEDAAGWHARADRLRSHLAGTLHLDPVPWPGPVQVRRYDRTILDGYAVENVQVETMPGFFVGANLYTPLNRTGPFPVVLCPHGHKRADANGSEGRFQPNYQKLCGTLARAGAVVLTWDMVGWGETTTVTHRRPESTALQTFNTMRMIDFVQTLPDVDHTRIGITGSSGGGTQTFLATALDQRITASAPAVMVSAHFFGGCQCESGFPVHDGTRGPVGRKDGLKTSNVEFAALAAPRPLLLISVGGDWTSNTPDVEYPYIQRIYGMLEAP
ncbi:MAG: acetylxylan esterase, partial [Phycisphaerales bacterium]|nr:acetylxylan esterase [Phycisphaerales bacterium]